MTNFQNTVIALIASFGVAYTVNTHGNGDVYISISSTAPAYRKCRNALKKEFGLIALWNKNNLAIGAADEKTILVVTTF